MDAGVFNVLAPDIQKSLSISDAVARRDRRRDRCAVRSRRHPDVARSSDRMSRKKLVAITMSIWSVIIVLTGAVQNVLPDVPRPARSRTRASPLQLPVSRPLLIDAYPIPARSRVFAVLGGAQAVGTMIAPFLAGAIAALGGGDDGWRLPFILLGLVALSHRPVGHDDQGTAAGPQRDAVGARRGAAAEARTSSRSRCRWRSSGCARSGASTTSWSAWPRSGSPSSARRCS